MQFRKENVILNTKFLLLLVYYVQCISLLEGTCVDGSRFIGVYSHTKCKLRACHNNIVSFLSSFPPEILYACSHTCQLLLLLAIHIYTSIIN